MFDRLVESTKQKHGRRAGRYFAITCVIYGLALCSLGIATVLTFSPVLAEEYTLMGMLPPPVPYSAPALPLIAQRTPHAAIPDVFAPPSRPHHEIPLPESASQYSRQIVSPGAQFSDLPPGGDRSGIGVPSSNGTGEPPPPPPPRPTPKSELTPTPTPKQGPQKVSEGVLQGSAIRKIKPDYPAIARQARAAGTVQIQVTISEEGRVSEAMVLSGHPLLRAAALEAARQWVFSPTTLSKVPVKVQGVLTFNFKLD